MLNSLRILRFAGLVAVALLLVLVARPAIDSAAAASQTDGPGQLRFTVKCLQVGESSADSLDNVACTLKVSGLPAPLGEVKVTLFEPEGDAGSPPVQATAAPQTPALDLPETAAGDLALISQLLPGEPLHFLSNTPSVPEPPPKFV